jgi:hypothetical protein
MPKFINNRYVMNKILYYTNLKLNCCIYSMHFTEKTELQTWIPEFLKLKANNIPWHRKQFVYTGLSINLCYLSLHLIFLLRLIICVLIAVNIIFKQVYICYCCITYTSYIHNTNNLVSLFENGVELSLNTDVRIIQKQSNYLWNLI